MKIFVGQIYSEVGASFPFATKFQIYIGEQLTKYVQPSELFLKKYSEEYELMFRMSSKSSITEIEIKGPTVFKKANDVEFSIFLPFDKNENYKATRYEKPLKQLIEGIISVLQNMEIDTSDISKNAPVWIKHILSTPEMIDADDVL